MAVWYSRILASLKKSTLFKDAFWSVLGNVIGKGFSLVAGILVARLLGKELYGEYGIIKTTLVMIAMFSSFGLGITATKFIAETKERAPSQVRSIIKFCYIISLGVSSVIALFIVIFSKQISSFIDAPHLSYVLRYSACVVIINALTTAQNGILGGFKAYKRIARNTIISGVLTFIFTVPLAYYCGFDGAIIALMLSLLVNCIINYITINSFLPFERGIADKSIFRDLVHFSFPVALQESLYALISWGSSFVIIKLSNYGELGILNAATQWMAVMAFVPGSLRNVALSYFSSANNNISTSHSLLRKLLLMNFFSVFIPCVIVWLLSSYICSFYGSEFVGMRRVLNVLAFSAVVTSMTNILTQELIAYNKNWYLFLTRLFRDAGILILTAVAIIFYSSGAFSYACVSVLFQSLYLLLLYFKYKATVRLITKDS